MKDVIINAEDVRFSYVTAEGAPAWAVVIFLSMPLMC